jgi:hypothetical protein
MVCDSLKNIHPCVVGEIIRQTPVSVLARRIKAKKKVSLAVVMAVEISLENQDLTCSKRVSRIMRESGVVNALSDAVASALVEKLSPIHSCACV